MVLMEGISSVYVYLKQHDRNSLGIFLNFGNQLMHVRMNPNLKNR